MAAAGKIGFLSQSGALLTALLGQEHSAKVGCSAFVSVGSLLDISWAEWLDYLARDPRTECLGVYVENLADPRSFFAAAREVAPHKPVILIKGGGNALDGPAPGDVFEEACRCSGVLRVHRISDLFRMAAHLTSRPAARGRRLAIVTNSRGPAVLAAEALRAGGGSLASLTPQTVTELSKVLTPRWDRQNPVDVGDDASADRFTQAANLVARDPQADALLALLAPVATIDPRKAAEGLCALARTCDKPVLACWMWGAANPECLAALQNAGIAAYFSPEAAIRTFSYLWRYSENLRCLENLREALATADEGVLDRQQSEAVLDQAQQAGRATLADEDARALFQSYALPTPERTLVRSARDAILAAEGFGYPVLVELPSSSCAGEPATDVIRVRADNAHAVRQAVRLLKLLAERHSTVAAPPAAAICSLASPGALSMTIHVQAEGNLGHVFRIAEAGRWPQTQAQGGMALVPLTPLAARTLIEQCLEKSRPGQDLHQLDLRGMERMLLGLSRLIGEQPLIEAITIGAILPPDHAMKVQDIRVTLRARPVGEEALSENKIAAEIVGSAG
jgi:acetyltransferase